MWISFAPNNSINDASCTGIMPVVIVAGEVVSLPEQGIIRAVAADLSVDIPVA
jgi:hypothetical protein